MRSDGTCKHCGNETGFVDVTVCAFCFERSAINVCGHPEETVIIRDTDETLSDYNFAATLFDVAQSGDFGPDICICKECARLLPSVRLRTAHAINIDDYNEHEELN